METYLNKSFAGEYSINLPEFHHEKFSCKHSRNEIIVLFIDLPWKKHAFDKWSTRSPYKTKIDFNILPNIQGVEKKFKYIGSWF